MLPKIQEYLSIGVEWVWVIDPEERAAISFTQQSPQGAVVVVLRTENPQIEIALEKVFDLDAGGRSPSRLRRIRARSD